MDNFDIIQNTNNLFKQIIDNPALNLDDKKEIHIFIVHLLKKFSEYIHATNEYVYTLQSITLLRDAGVIDQTEFEYQLKMIDTLRKTKHDAIIDACNQLNRQCDFYNIPRICDINVRDRAIVAKFALDISTITHYYALDHNNTVDEIIHNQYEIDK